MVRRGSLSQGSPQVGAGMLAGSIAGTEMYNMLVQIIQEQKNIWLTLRSMVGVFAAQFFQIFMQLGALKTANMIGDMISTPFLSGLAEGAFMAGATIGTSIFAQQIQGSFG